jgi:hypothetical protein
MYIGLHVKCPVSCSILKNIKFSQQIFEKSSNIKFHENPSTESRIIPLGQTDRQTGGRSDIYDEANGHFSQFFELD